jgi:hypothetical protein
MSQSQSAANIVAFSSRKTKSPPPAKPSEDDLIRACVAYARAISGYDAGFAADPSGNGDEEGNRLWRRSELLLAKIARTPAQTAKGLQAKARIAPVVIKAGNLPDDSDQTFLASFASEVKEFLEPRLRSADVAPST